MTIGGCAVDIDWAVNEDFPIFKKYGVMNSGLLDSTRYNKTIFDSLAVVKVKPYVNAGFPSQKSRTYPWNKVPVTFMIFSAAQVV